MISYLSYCDQLQGYSHSLEMTAGSYASRCLFEHSSIPGVGENLFATTGIPVVATMDLRSYIYTHWGNSEKENYNFETNQCAEGKVCGHYTQVI